MISVALPIHRKMLHFEYFFKRAIHSIESQTFTDYEIVVTEEGSMPVNTNAAIRKCKGEIIKILYMDDYLSHPYALQNIVDSFTPETPVLAQPQGPFDPLASDVAPETPSAPPEEPTQA